MGFHFEMILDVLEKSSPLPMLIVHTVVLSGLRSRTERFPREISCVALPPSGFLRRLASSVTDGRACGSILLTPWQLSTIHKVLKQPINDILVESRKFLHNEVR